MRYKYISGPLAGLTTDRDSVTWEEMLYPLGLTGKAGDYVLDPRPFSQSAYGWHPHNWVSGEFDGSLWWWNR